MARPKNMLRYINTHILRHISFELSIKSFLTFLTSFNILIETKIKIFIGKYFYSTIIKIQCKNDSIL